MNAADFKKVFDPELRHFLDEKIVEASKVSGGSDIDIWVAYLERLLMAGGKRLRPFVAYLMYKTAGGRNEKAILNAIISLEVFHIFALIHDDIIDRGTIRHGIPTLHQYIVQQGQSDHIAMAQAMLVGDLAFNWSTFCLPNSGFSAERWQAGQQVFQNMITEVILGEMLDVNCLGKSAISSEVLQKKMELKTARYTFVRPLQLGTVLATSDQTLQAFCKDFGTAIGLAYQIQDDMFDLTSTESKGGKTVLNDIILGQPTIFTQYIIEQGTTQEQKALAAVFAESRAKIDHEKVRELFRSSGALAYGEKLSQDYFNRAQHALQILGLPAKKKQDWQNLLDHVRNRVA